MRILALIDDFFICNHFKSIIDEQFGNKVQVDYRFSYNVGHKETEYYKPINIKKQEDEIIKKYDIIFSLCSQIFSKKIVKNIRCINFHFGILPYACGVAPIIFSIINDIPLGVTVHLIDEEIDNGNIIYQEVIRANDYDTSKDIEVKCQKKLSNILTNHMNDLIFKKYSAKKVEGERRYFSLNDLNNLCAIDLSKVSTRKELVNLLRALQFGDKGAGYFISETGHKMKISVKFEKNDL